MGNREVRPREGEERGCGRFPKACDEEESTIVPWTNRLLSQVRTRLRDSKATTD